MFGCVDYEKAFDSIEHPELFKAMEEIGINEGYVTNKQINKQKNKKQNQTKQKQTHKQTKTAWFTTNKIEKGSFRRQVNILKYCFSEQF